MKKVISTLILSSLLIVSVLSISGCNKDGVNTDFGAMAQNVGQSISDGVGNLKDSALKQINSEVETFMEENNIPKDKVGEVTDIAKQWAKTALTASGEIDKAKGSLKEYLAEHLDDLDVSSSKK